MSLVLFARGRRVPLMDAAPRAVLAALDDGGSSEDLRATGISCLCKERCMEQPGGGSKSGAKYPMRWSGLSLVMSGMWCRMGDPGSSPGPFGITARRHASRCLIASRSFSVLVASSLSRFWYARSFDTAFGGLRARSAAVSGSSAQERERSAASQLVSRPRVCLSHDAVAVALQPRHWRLDRSGVKKLRPGGKFAWLASST